MQTFHRARVQPADIDNLGHMNVRVYARHAGAAVHGLFAALGLDEPALAALGARIEQPDCHTLFRREQHLGAALAVRAGVLSAQDERVEVYLELYNEDSDELSATFRKLVRLVRRADAAPLVFPRPVLAAARGLLLEWPAHGRPRSLALDSVRCDVTTADMAAHGIPVRFDGYEVTAAMSTPEGDMDLSGAPWLAFADTPPRREDSEQIEEESWFSDGNVGIATLESRHVLVSAPRKGETVETYTSITDVARKVVRFRHWSFAKPSGRLLAILDEVGIGLDLESRHSCELPPAMRAELEARSHPELM